LAEEARLAEEACLAETMRLAKGVRLSEEARLAEDAYLTEEVRLAKEARCVPYDAAARLAYESGEKSLPYGTFKTRYEEDAVALVASKFKLRALAAFDFDTTIPYDAAARLAYESSDKSISYEAFKAKYGEDAVASVTSKFNHRHKATFLASSAVDLTIPYDAAARLSYESSDQSLPYDVFKAAYEEDAIVLVKSKSKSKAAFFSGSALGVSIPYDAAARLAYESSDKSLPYEIFKAKYEEDAITLVKSKSKTKSGPTDSPAFATDALPSYDTADYLTFDPSNMSLLDRPYEVEVK